MSIAFKLTERFEVAFDSNEVFLDDVLSNDVYRVGHPDGEGYYKMTDEGLERLAMRAPFFDQTRFRETRSTLEYTACITVADVCRWVAHKTGVDWPVEPSNA